MCSKREKPIGLCYIGRVLRGVRIDTLKSEIEKAKARSGRSRVSLFFDMLYCAVRYGAGYHDYVTFGFYHLKHAERDTYVTRLRNKRMVVQLNDAESADDFDCKSRFDARFHAFIGREFLAVAVMTPEAFCQFMQDKAIVFAKPDVGECGKGIEKLKRADFESLDRMYAYLKEKGFGVVEQQLVQHERMTRLYPHSINSLRIVTLVTQHGGERRANCVYAVVKTGNGGHFVDNVENGGMFCPVDIRTGKICGVAVNSKIETFEAHPYTGIAFVGYEIPFVKEAVALCEKAALVEPKMRFLGWDVCITPTGPAIIEGNDYSGYDFWQQSAHTPEKKGLWYYYKKMLPELEL